MSGTTQQDVDKQPPDGAGEASPRVVLFDFDGVLIRGDAFYLFMRERYARSLWRRLLAFLISPLSLFLLPFSRRWPLRMMVRIALFGLDERRYHAAAKAFGISLARRSRLFCRDGLRRLRQHQTQGDRVIVVTGCEHHLVSAILQELGLTQIEVLASTLRPGWVGMRPLRHNVGSRKVQTLNEYGVGAWQVAYGDSMYDVAMLKLASEAVLVNGSPALCKKVEKALGRAVSRVEWF
ncbi:MAG: HAD family hydrolase [Rhodanobacter sp.]